MSNRYWQPPALDLALAPSALLWWLAVMLLGLSLLALWISAADWRLCVLASPLVAVLAWWELRRSTGRTGQWRIRRLCCEAGRWWLVTEPPSAGEGAPSANTLELRLLPGSLVLPRVVLLRMSAPQWRRPLTLLLAADAYAPDDWRRLQLKLRESQRGIRAEADPAMS